MIAKYPKYIMYDLRTYDVKITKKQLDTELIAEILPFATTLSYDYVRLMLHKLRTVVLVIHWSIIKLHYRETKVSLTMRIELFILILTFSFPVTDIGLHSLFCHI